MLPTLWPADVLCIEARPASALLPGEIVLVDVDGYLRAHRAVGNAWFHGEEWLITRGDALPQNDPPVAPAQLLGVVTLVNRGNRQFRPRTKLGVLEGALAKFLQSSPRLARFLLRLQRLFR
jgi:hypothetical protein